MRKAFLLAPVSLLVGLLAVSSLRGQQETAPPTGGGTPETPGADATPAKATPAKKAAPKKAATVADATPTPIPKGLIILTPQEPPGGSKEPANPNGPAALGIPTKNLGEPRDAGTPGNPAAPAFPTNPGAMTGLSGEPNLTLGMGPATSVSWVPPHAAPRPPRNWIDQTLAEANAKSVGCMECHRTTDAKSMHTSKYVVLGCTDCHGGDARRGLTLQQAHVKPLHPEFWQSSANPPNSNVLLNHESPEWIRFVNPGDLRVADIACGLCHADIVKRVPNEMMNHGGMLWNAAAYNNGVIDLKNDVLGQAYGKDGTPLQLNAPFAPTAEETRMHGWLPLLLPLHLFNRSMPGNTYRIFEKGGEKPLDLGNPTPDEPPGKPERRLSDRGEGTLLRTDPTVLGASKTRLQDPLLEFFGSNDHPGDYRSSGCSACHVIYANDRSPTNSGWWHRFGNQGLSFSKDPMIPKNERGHPILHEFTRSIPSSLCMNCHMHQGNLFVNPFLGFVWWDQETDGQFMYPKEQHDPTDDEMVVLTRANPEAASARGNWRDLTFLEKVSELNPQMKHTQISDYHGHGWLFRAIFKHDREGNLLDREENKVPFGDFKHAVHLKDIHLEKGMQCVDCHFEVEVHGNGLLYGEPRNMTTIMCIDCHGTVDKRPTLITSGAGGTWDGHSRKTEPVNLATLSSPYGPRFEWEDVIDPLTGTVKLDVRGQPIRRLYQNLNVSGQRREVPQTMDIVDPTHPRYNAKARYAKTLLRDGVTWGSLPDSPEKMKADLAHSNQKMDCQICHTSWATSCFGCHLSQKANQHVPQNKYEGVTERNFITYNPQVVRDDVFQLGIDGTVKGHRMAVLRSSSAVIASSQNSNREWIYYQQQTVSGDGYAGQAYNPHFAHTTSSHGTTKNCEDCHLSKANDNNAWMASLLGFGTGTVNFFGRTAWVGGDGALTAIKWTEEPEPQAPYGSHLQELAYPKNYEEHVAHGMKLEDGELHRAHVINDLTLRGEYLYTANGSNGLQVFDMANFNNKGFSETFVTEPVSPLGQRTYVHTKNAVAVALPSTLLEDSKRIQLPVNEEQPIHKFYGHVYVIDSVEGLVVVNVETLFDGHPYNNFLRRVKLGADDKDKGGVEADHYNPDGRLTGATYGVCAGRLLYVTSPQGLTIINLDEPTRPRLVGELNGYLNNPKCIYTQFRYAFVTDDDGLKVLDISDPIRPRPIRGAEVHLRHAAKLYVARTYAYVADGEDGLAIIDVKNPEHPWVEQMYTAEGRMNDVRAVQIGSVNASMYALVADGKNGFKVLQMISPDTVPGSAGFSPKPAPHLIAWYPTKGAALSVSRGLDRDRVTDETGDQTVVFSRRGSRPFHLDEMRPFLRHSDGEWYKVEDVFLKDGKVMTKHGVEIKPPDSDKQLTAPGAPGAPAGTVTPPMPAYGVPPGLKLQPLDNPAPAPGESPAKPEANPPTPPPATPSEPEPPAENPVTKPAAKPTPAPAAEKPAVKAGTPAPSYSVPPGLKFQKLENATPPPTEPPK